MTNEQINRAVAEELGWKHNGHGAWHKDGQVRGLVAEDLEEFGYVEALPNYAGDYNAVAEMRRAVKKEEQNEFVRALWSLVEPAPKPAKLENYWAVLDALASYWTVLNATPRQQAEAFLRMRGKWIE